LGVAGWSSVQAQTREHPRHFIAQCLGAQTAQGAVSADLLERFNASLADWRWGSLLGALQELLAVDTPIRRHWCAELMEEGRKKKRKKEGEGAAEQEAQAEPRDQTSQPANQTRPNQRPVYVRPASHIPYIRRGALHFLAGRRRRAPQLLERKRMKWM